MVQPTFDDYNRVMAFINIHGLDNFNVKAVKSNSPELVNIISGHLGGFKEVKEMIKRGELTITPMPAINVKSEEGVIENKYYLEVKQELTPTDPITKQEEKEIENIPQTLITQGTNLLEGFMSLLGNIENRLDDISNKVDNLNSQQSESITLPNMAIPTYIPESLLNVMDNLKAIGLKPAYDLRSRINSNVHKYVAYKYKEENLSSHDFGVAVGETYTEFYKILIDLSNIKSKDNKTLSLSEITKGFINLANIKRRKEGLKLLPITKKELTGFCKIDIVEKLGLLDIMYYITEYKLDELGLLLPTISEPVSILKGEKTSAKGVS